MLKHLQPLVDTRYAELLDTGRCKITLESRSAGRAGRFRRAGHFSTTVGESKQQKEFIAQLRDLVARGRTAGIIVLAAAQRPSTDIIPTSLRDLFGYRWAFHCTTDVVLRHGWASEGYTAADIDPTARGVG